MYVCVYYISAISVECRIGSGCWVWITQLGIEVSARLAEIQRLRRGGFGWVLGGIHSQHKSLLSCPCQDVETEEFSFFKPLCMRYIYLRFCMAECRKYVEKTLRRAPRLHKNSNLTLLLLYITRQLQTSTLLWISFHPFTSSISLNHPLHLVTNKFTTLFLILYTSTINSSLSSSTTAVLFLLLLLHPFSSLRKILLFCSIQVSRIGSGYHLFTLFICTTPLLLFTWIFDCLLFPPMTRNCSIHFYQS